MHFKNRVLVLYIITLVIFLTIYVCVSFLVVCECDVAGTCCLCYLEEEEIEYIFFQQVQDSCVALCKHLFYCQRLIRNLLPFLAIAHPSSSHLTSPDKNTSKARIGLPINKNTNDFLCFVGGFFFRKIFHPFSNAQAAKLTRAVNLDK